MSIVMRVDILLSDRKPYTFEAYAAEWVSKGFEKVGIPFQKIYLCDGGLRDYLQRTPPTWTLGFTSLLPHEKPLCDILRVPHFYWVEDSVASALHYTRSEYAKLGVNNPALSHQIPNAYYLPLGVERSSPNKERFFEAVLFGDIIDLEILRKRWPKEGVVKIEEALEAEDPLLAGRFYREAEQYLRGLKVQKQIASFTGERLDVFGEPIGANWLKRLPPSVHLQSKLPYREHFEVLKMSQSIVLDEISPWLLPALAHGCIPLLEEKKPLHSGGVLEPCSWEKQITRLIEIMR